MTYKGLILLIIETLKNPILCMTMQIINYLNIGNLFQSYSKTNNGCTYPGSLAYMVIIGSNIFALCHQGTMLILANNSSNVVIQDLYVLTLAPWAT
jgi:hypothetical protein